MIFFHVRIQAQLQAVLYTLNRECHTKPRRNIGLSTPSTGIKSRLLKILVDPASNRHAHAHRGDAMGNTSSAGLSMPSVISVEVHGGIGDTGYGISFNRGGAESPRERVNCGVSGASWGFSYLSNS